MSFFPLLIGKNPSSITQRVQKLFDFLLGSVFQRFQHRFQESILLGSKYVEFHTNFHNFVVFQPI